MAEKAAKTKTTATPRTKVSEICDALESLAPTRLAQAWDNVGLLAGDRNASARAALLCIDLTPAVVDEALEKPVQFIMAYHPPIFKPISRLTVPSNDTDEAVFRCIAGGIAVYSTHTALDAAHGGTNDTIAALCNLAHTEPLEYHDDETGGQCKIVVFVPGQDLEKVAEAMFRVGAGWIGDYQRCSFRLLGTGTFCGGDTTKPTVGQAGRFERVKEVRLEAIAPRSAVSEVIKAIRSAHPYEEPAFDVYPLLAAPEDGIGRVGQLPEPTPVGTLARKLKDRTKAASVQVVGDPAHQVSRAIICVGAAGSLPFKIGLKPTDVIITGEIRHHDALRIERVGCSAIALGHWASERPVLAPLAERLGEKLKKLNIIVSKADRDPFTPI